MKQAEFLSSYHWDALLRLHRLNLDQMTDLRIGFDGCVYALFADPIPDEYISKAERAWADSEYFALRLTVDWREEEVVGSACRALGKLNLRYPLISPLGEGLLAVGSRCRYFPVTGPEMNAVILDAAGNAIRTFCLGDGIENIMTTDTGEIITSYFGEGIFGSYGWDHPIGSPGVIRWNERGEKLWQAKGRVWDCYAVNLDAQNRLWYYYYSDFLLVQANAQDEKAYDPHIRGALGFLLTADGKHIVFHDRMSSESLLSIASITEDRIGAFEPLSLTFSGHHFTLSSVPGMRNFSFYKSKAVFLDHHGRLFVKQFRF